MVARLAVDNFHVSLACGLYRFRQEIRTVDALASFTANVVITQRDILIKNDLLYHFLANFLAHNKQMSEKLYRFPGNFLEMDVTIILSLLFLVWPVSHRK